jgi:hypothetical protein
LQLQAKNSRAKVVDKRPDQATNPAGDSEARGRPERKANSRKHVGVDMKCDIQLGSEEQCPKSERRMPHILLSNHVSQTINEAPKCIVNGK